MIGQKNILHKIDTIDEKSIPQFIVVSGLRGSGKTSIINYLNDTKIHSHEIVNITSIDDIREICMSAVTFTSNRLFVLSDFDSMNFRAKESILKLCEDIPKNLFIIIETSSLENIKQTLISRAYTITLQNYTYDELYDFCSSLENINNQEIEYLLVSFKTPGDIIRARSCGILELYAFCYKVINNIFIANTFNAMKIADKLKLKSDSSGFDLDLFFTVIMNCAKYSNTVEQYRKLIFATSDALKKLNFVKSINKVALFDNWLFNVKGANV